MTTKTHSKRSRVSIRKRNKAEIAGQTFLYILGIVIVAAVLIYGIRAMFSLSEKTDEVKMVEFREDLKKMVVGNLRMDSVINKDISVPGEFSEICFIDLSENPPQNCVASLDPIICDSWTSNIKNNVFLIDKIPKEFIYIENYKGDEILNFETTNHYLCTKINSGKFKLNAIGKGKYVLIKQPPNN